jgi:hypothetical protein
MNGFHITNANCHSYSSVKTISKLKTDLEEAEDLMTKEKEEAKRTLEKKLREETSRMSRDTSEKIEKLELELAEFRSECDRLKQTHSEDSVLAESEKQQALLMAQQVTFNKIEETRNKQTNKRTNKQTNKQTNKRTNKHTNKKSNRQLNNQNKQTKQTNKTSKKKHKQCLPFSMFNEYLFFSFPTFL